MMPTSQVLFSPASLSQLCLLSSCVTTSDPWGRAVERDLHQMGTMKLFHVCGYSWHLVVVSAVLGMVTEGSSVTQLLEGSLLVPLQCNTTNSHY